MAKTKTKRKVDIKPSAYEFVTEVPWSDKKSILVHFRYHGGRTYVSIRVWYRHQVKDVWYPTKKGFIIPVRHAESLCQAIMAAAQGDWESKPEWLVDFEEQERFRGVLPAKSA